jgi:putative nucleotidyltransferase with HDIG domain
VNRDITERKLAEFQIQRQLEQLSALRNIDQAIISNINLHFTLNTILDEVRKQLQVDAADILLLNSAGSKLEFVAGQGFRARSIETAAISIETSLAGRVVNERRMITIENLSKLQDLGLGAVWADEDFVFYSGVPLIAKTNIQGIMEIFHRSSLQPTPDWLDFLKTLAGQAAIAVDNATLFENLQNTNQELVMAYDTTIEGWSRALDLRDRETEGHTLRVTEMTLTLARRLGFNEDALIHIRRGALLHDIGKMGVPDNILLKPEALTAVEWMVMRQHPLYAYELLKPISFLEPSLDIPYCHHEKWDGTGYPRRLKEEEIPLAARLFAVVDVWDALTSDRPYRSAWSENEALTYIQDQSSHYFDPEVVGAFFEMTK